MFRFFNDVVFFAFSVLNVFHEFFFFGYLSGSRPNCSDP